jgi:hypothetical protein
MSPSSTLSFTLVVIIFLCLGSGSTSAQDEFRVIRVLNPNLARTLADVCAVSAGARDLVDRLERSDLLIHVVALGMDRQRQFIGTTRFVTSAGGRRILRVAVDERLPVDRRAAALAHELQHAAEIADAAHVADQASFAALYREIGYPSGGDPHANCFETPEAIRAGARVLDEFRNAAGRLRRRGRMTAEGK